MKQACRQGDAGGMHVYPPPPPFQTEIYKQQYAKWRRYNKIKGSHQLKLRSLACSRVLAKG